MAKSNSTANGGDVLRFDAVVVGSGYGGAVSALRLAQAGMQVAILETGYRHKAPNMPRGEDSIWSPAEQRFGPHTVRKLNHSVKAWYGTAYGGGSIVNAAVMIRKDNFENWPGGITRQSLDPYYDRSESMLEAAVYPVHFSGSPYQATRKTVAMLSAAAKLGVPSVMPPVAVQYLQEGQSPDAERINKHGAVQKGCRRCGECSLPGCNYQAKNSLDYNYLFTAENRFGARPFTGLRADKIEPVTFPAGGSGYRVSAVDSKTGAVSLFECKILVVAAGSVGSSELLLRNRNLYATLPGLSHRLGRQYTTNGTFIGFAIRSKESLDPSGGPEITAGLDFNGPDGRNQGHLMFDGSFRGFTYETFYVTGRLIGLKDWAIKLVSRGFRLLEKFKWLQPDTTLPLLVIGRDKAVGRFSLNSKGEITTDLNPRDNASFYATANKHLRAYTKAMGASFLPFPLWSLRKKIDVPHNLGGVPMGESRQDGVVDHLGRAFGYDNLLVLDGSIIPQTMGANPALTIAALAERSMEHVLAQWKQEGCIRAEPASVAGLGGDSDSGVTDMSRAFGDLHDFVKQSAMAGMKTALPIEARGKKVLWTPGILARHMGNHSRAVLERFKSLGLEVEALPVNTDADTAGNVLLIQESIGKLTDGQGILIGHSRGGCMNLDAYRQLSPEEKAKIWRIILVQSPINGSPVADWLVSKNWLRTIIGATSRVIFGASVVDTLVELSSRGREYAQRGLPALTPEDLAKIVTVRTRIKKGQSKSFDLTRWLNAKYGQESDGMTPYDASALPGVVDVTIDGYDHEQFVIQEPTLLKRATLYRAHPDYHAGDVAEALIRLCARL
jgi:choline dehydrogenase-like flavoprotein